MPTAVEDKSLMTTLLEEIARPMGIFLLEGVVAQEQLTLWSAIQSNYWLTAYLLQVLGASRSLAFNILEGRSKIGLTEKRNTN